MFMKLALLCVTFYRVAGQPPVTFPTIAPSVCSNVFTCPAPEQFETQLRVDFGDGFLATSDNLPDILAGIVDAYDVSAGLACDDCARRVLDVTVDYVPGISNPATAGAVLEPSTYVLVTLLMGQVGGGGCNRRKAFDTNEPPANPFQIDYYVNACGNFVSAGSCCCACNFGGATGGGTQAVNSGRVSRADFVRLLNQFHFPVELVREIRPEAGTCDPNVVTKEDALAIAIGYSLPVASQDDFLRAFMKVYNQQTLENCFFLQILAMEFVDDPSTRRLQGGTASTNRINALYGCRPNVCPSSPGGNIGNFFTSFRRLDAQKATDKVDADKEHTSRNLQEVDSPFLYDCLCLDDDALPEPSRMLPELGSFLSAFNAELGTIGLESIEGIEDAVLEEPTQSPVTPPGKKRRWKDQAKGYKGYRMKEKKSNSMMSGKGKRNSSMKRKMNWKGKYGMKMNAFRMSTGGTGYKKMMKTGYYNKGMR